MLRFSGSKAISTRLRGFRHWAFALPTSLLLILVLIGSGLAQQLSDTIDPVAQDVIREVSRYFADTPVLDAHLAGIGFQPNRQDASWRRMPAVRKIETAYLAAQSLSQGDADRLLSRLAKQTVTAYESARSVPTIVELSAHDTPDPLRFAAIAKPLDPAVWSPPPLAQKAILEISRYVDGGSLGGTANLMQFYLQVPGRDAYQILRTSRDSAEAIKRAMTYVPEAERKPRMTRIIDDLAQSHPDVKRAPALIAFLNDANATDGTTSPSGRGDGPEDGDTTTAVTRPGTNPGGRNGATGVQPSNGRANTADVQALRRGIANGWVVTRNPSGKIFVHASSSGGYLRDLKYLVEESADGRTWTVHLPEPGNRETRYGRTVGVIEKPESVEVGSCSCM